MVWSTDDFSKTPGHLLRRCHQVAVALFLDECAEFDLTPLQFAILSALEKDGPQDQITLGGTTAIDRTTVTVVARNLEEHGLIERKKSPRDKRYNIVSLTKSGRELVRDILPAVENAQQRIVEPLDKEESDQLIMLLEKMMAANNKLSRAPIRPKS
ncbi:MAG: MarR family transcriptional regulator [Rhizobiaceae bacterium]|nr:MarR family transcriptional regulator [Rhizobiaceae bacterium]